MHGARRTGMILLNIPGLKSASTTSVLMTSIEKGKLFFTPLMWHASILCVNNFILIDMQLQSRSAGLKYFVQVGKLGGHTNIGLASESVGAPPSQAASFTLFWRANHGEIRPGGWRKRLTAPHCASLLSLITAQGIDLKAGGRNKKVARVSPKSENVYLRLLVKVPAVCLCNSRHGIGIDGLPLLLFRAALPLPRQAHGEQVQQGRAEAHVHEQDEQASSVRVQAGDFPAGQGPWGAAGLKRFPFLIANFNHAGGQGCRDCWQRDR